MEWEAPWWDDWTGGGIANMISKVFKVAKTTLSRSETEPTRPLRLNQLDPSLIRGPKSAVAGSAQNGHTLPKFDLSRQFKQKDQ